VDAFGIAFAHLIIAGDRATRLEQITHEQKGDQCQQLLPIIRR